MEKIAKTTYPDVKIPYNEWCELFKVGTRWQMREGINNANRIMELWDSYFGTKEKFVKNIKTKDD